MTPFHYVIIRKELTGGAALAQVGHAAGESAALWSLSQFRDATASPPPRRISFGPEEGFFTPAGTELPLGCDPLDHQLPVDTRLAVLGATKEQLAQLLDGLLRENVQHSAIVETDGPLQGMVTAIGLVAEDKAALAKLVPALAELRPFALK